MGRSRPVSRFNGTKDLLTGRTPPKKTPVTDVLTKCRNTVAHFRHSKLAAERFAEQVHSFTGRLTNADILQLCRLRSASSPHPATSVTSEQTFSVANVVYDPRRSSQHLIFFNRNLPMVKYRY